MRPITATYAKHLAHVAQLTRLFEQVRECGEGMVPVTPADLYLVRDEGLYFWELIGFRPRGHEATLFGAVRFKRQPGSTVPFARRSLIHYLSTPPKEIAVAKAVRAPGMLKVLLPATTEDLPSFRERIRAGDRARALYLDSDILEFAFDFRLDNPSMEKDVNARSAMDYYLLRTVRGHLLIGASFGLHMKLHRGESFVAVRTPVQYTPTHRHSLPTLALHRQFLAMASAIDSAEEAEAWMDDSVPFLRGSSAVRHFLLPDAG
jgi:hypothetical protein